ncbi:MAG: HlyD family secretion protein [Francisellaceae bacterium]
MFKRLKKKLNLATIIFAIGALIALIYFASYLFTITDNAFVVKIISPVSAKVSGTVTQVYVKNGEEVKKGQRLFELDDESYVLQLEAAEAQYLQAQKGIDALEKNKQMSQYNQAAAKDNLKLLQYQYQQKSKVNVKNAVPFMELQDLSYQISAQENTVAALSQQIEAQVIEIEQAKIALKSLKAAWQQAQLNLDHTTVRAQADGIINNMFLGVGTAVRVGESVFSLVDNKVTYVQGNFNETEVSGVRPGDRVDIYPRAYLGEKVFHGVVESLPLGVSRQHTNPLTGTQIVLSENKWLLLPQRLPVIIKVEDRDENYPLQAGMSAYVYIHVK